MSFTVSTWQPRKTRREDAGTVVLPRVLKMFTIVAVSAQLMVSSNPTGSVSGGLFSKLMVNLHATDIFER